MEEFSLIEKYFAPLAKSEKGAAELKDDAAFLSIKSKGELVITSDTIVEGVHYLENTRPELIAKKLLRVNISDIASKAAKPVYYMLNATLNRGINEEWVAAFSSGLRQDQSKFGVRLVGGDTTATSSATVLSVTMFGESMQPVKRKGAKPGHQVYVTGTIGDSCIGLKLQQKILESNSIGRADYFTGRYELPEPRVSLSPYLSKLATAACDISDGLVSDLGHICSVSNCSALLYLDKIPLHPSAAKIVREHKLKLTELITHGDDYEIVFTVHPRAEHYIPLISEKTGLKLTRIGEIVNGSGVLAVDEKGMPVPISRKGYSHFS